MPCPKSALTLTVVSPDAGGVERARAFAKRLGVSLAIVDKRRKGKNEVEVMHVIGDVSGRNVLIVDDIIDTAGTLINTVAALKEAGAERSSLITLLLVGAMAGGVGYACVRSAGGVFAGRALS